MANTSASHSGVALGPIFMPIGFCIPVKTPDERYQFVRYAFLSKASELIGYTKGRLSTFELRLVHNVNAMLHVRYKNRLYLNYWIVFHLLFLRSPKHPAIEFTMV